MLSLRSGASHISPRVVARLPYFACTASAAVFSASVRPSGEYFTLDEVGGRVWELCDGTRSIDEIATIVTEEYDAPLDRVSETPFGRVEVSHVCLNDGVVEGLRCLDVPAFSVQYHPEAAAGPHDAAYLFDRFVELMRDERQRRAGGTALVNDAAPVNNATEGGA